VFDGATPQLKRQTVAARRARRESSSTKLRRVAEKVVANALLQRQIQASLGQQRQRPAEDVDRGVDDDCTATLADAAAGEKEGTGNAVGGQSWDGEWKEDEQEAAELRAALALSKETPSCVAAAAAASAGDQSVLPARPAAPLAARKTARSPMAATPAASAAAAVSGDDHTVGGGSVWHGEPLHDRASVFHAHATFCHSEGAAHEFRQAMEHDSVYGEADHQIMAFRYRDHRESSSSQKWQEGYDDDGESQGGRRVLAALQGAHVDGLCVVVSRWWGGTNLGQDRFRHIFYTARQLVRTIVGEHAQQAVQGTRDGSMADSGALATADSGELSPERGAEAGSAESNERMPRWRRRARAEQLSRASTADEAPTRPPGVDDAVSTCTPWWTSTYCVRKL
jgi:hypothetical protein